MGVKNLWGVLSSTGQLVAVGSPGDPVKGSALATACKKSASSSFLPNYKTKQNLPSPAGDLQLSMSALCLSDDTDSASNINTPEISSHDIGQSFSGQAVAIDLSCWVCDSQANSNMHAVIRPHLRNLVFRTWSLLSVGVLPVFVVEGIAPELKQATMQARNAQRGCSSSQRGATNRATRRRFNSVLKECCELFELLGVPWVQAEGEAEATCAALLYNKAVCGVISEDSDVLLYGGDNVLRNFSVQANRPTAEIITLSNIETKLHLPRDCLVVLSLLLGCDYLPAGVTGVGVSSAVKLLSHWGQTGVHAIEKFKSWASISVDLNAPVAKFKKNGDIDTLEAAIRDRAVRTEGFPFANVVQEFTARLNLPQGGALSGLCWKQPDYTGLLSWCERKLSWEPGYSTEKVSLFCARWVACHAPAPETLSRCALQASRIVKTCTRGGVASYEVEWRTIRHSGRENRGGAGEEGALVTTIEPQQMVQFAAPRLVDHFEEEKVAKKKGKSKKKKVANDETVKRLPRKNGNKKCQESSKQLKLAVCSTASGPSLTLAKVSKSDVLKTSGNEPGFVHHNFGTSNDTKQYHQHPDPSTLPKKDKDRREEGYTNQSNFSIRGKISKNKTCISVSSNNDGPGSEGRGHSSLLNANKPSSKECIEVVDLDSSDDLSSHIQSPPFMEDSLLNFDSFGDVKGDSLLASDDDLENDVSFLVDRFINLNVDQRKELRDHQLISSGSSKERSQSVENIKRTNVDKFKESCEGEDLENYKENSPLLSLRERAKIHVDKKQNKLPSPIPSESNEFNSDDLLAYTSDDQCSANGNKQISDTIALDEAYENMIENYGYESPQKKELSTIVKRDSGYSEVRQIRILGDRFGSSVSKSNPIQVELNLDDTTALHHDSLRVVTDTTDKLLSHTSSTNSHSWQVDCKKLPFVGADNSYSNERGASVFSDCLKEADTISLSHESQTLIGISGSVEVKACDGSFDLFDDSLASESSYCSTTVDKPQQVPLSPSQPEVTSLHQSSGMPCFKLLDSFWIDSNSFLCTPSPTKRTVAAPCRILEDNSDNTSLSSPRFTHVRTTYQNVPYRSHFNIQNNNNELSSQLRDGEHLIAVTHSPDVDKSFDDQSNSSEHSDSIGNVTQNSNLDLTSCILNEADSTCNANLMNRGNSNSWRHHQSRSHSEEVTAVTCEDDFRSVSVKCKVDAVAHALEIDIDSLPSTLLKKSSTCSLTLPSTPPSSVAMSSKPALLSPCSFSLSPCLLQPSLADRMKVKYGKKTVTTLLPHTKL